MTIVAELPSSEKYRKLERTPIGSTSSSIITLPASPHPLQRSHLASMSPRPTLQSLRQKLQTASYQKHSIPTRQPYPGTASAFYIPSNSLVPAKPKSQVNPSTPKRQSEVSEEFDKVKVGTQVAFGTWFTWTDGYLRTFGEDDLAFLGRKVCLELHLFGFVLITLFSGG